MKLSEQALVVAQRHAAHATDRATAELQLTVLCENSQRSPESILLETALLVIDLKTRVAALERAQV